MQEKPVSWFTAVRSGAITCRKMQHIRPTKTEYHWNTCNKQQVLEERKQYETVRNICKLTQKKSGNYKILMHLHQRVVTGEQTVLQFQKTQ